MGIWLEIVTLLIPGFNDSDDELKRLTEFVAGVSADVPWHVTAFHKDYKMTDPGDTRPEDLLRASEIGKQAGLRFVYAGNLPGRVGGLEDTTCPNCRKVLVKRYSYLVKEYHLTAQGTCPDCGIRVPGRWAGEFDGQIASVPFLPRRSSRLFLYGDRLFAA
jgi:pyruvate formate lyase activating enzyme